MIKYIDCGLSRHFLTKIIDEEKRERIRIVSDIVNSIRLNDIGVHEYGKYMLAIEKDKITIVTPKQVYIKRLMLH